MDMEIVNSYVAKLRAALGDADAFATVYFELEGDRKVRQQEAAGIAKSFYGKNEAFRRIRSRQNAIMDSLAKTRAQAGKSAA
jgi:hypothetical protein